jgi:hypothetical protein
MDKCDHDNDPHIDVTITDTSPTMPGRINQDFIHSSVTSFQFGTTTSSHAFEVQISLLSSRPIYRETCAVNAPLVCPTTEYAIAPQNMVQTLRTWMHELSDRFGKGDIVFAKNYGLVQGPFELEMICMGKERSLVSRNKYQMRGLLSEVEALVLKDVVKAIRRELDRLIKLES